MFAEEAAMESAQSDVTEFMFAVPDEVLALTSSPYSESVGMIAYGPMKTLVCLAGMLLTIFPHFQAVKPKSAYWLEVRY
jgi:hypothetical protein